MKCYHARWVVPVTAPSIHDGTVAVEDGRIAYVGPRASAPPGDDVDLEDAVLLPGLVNAHTHLELTAFRGLMPDVRFRDWIVTLQAAKVTVMTPERYLDAARLGLTEGLRAGITTYADTCDSGVALAAMREMGVRGIMYQEVFCPSADDARVADAIAGLSRRLTELAPRQTPLVRLGVSPHAPYTVCDALFAYAARAGYPVAVHIAESEAETRLVRDADGPFADGLRSRGIAVEPRARSPIALLDALGVLNTQPLLIHAVRIDDADIEAIASHGASVAHCPVSNAKLGHGIAPLDRLLAAGVAVGLGSDSMAANDRMDLLEEARVATLAQRTRTGRHDTIAPRDALALATIGGARALGVDHLIGSLEVGKDADLAAFPLPAGFGDGNPEIAAVFALGGTPARLVTVGGILRAVDGRVLTGDRTVPDRVRDTASRLAAHLASGTA
ncbi:MAG TPA: amidohydrolase family protein [Gemmatimonadaceae bacterium]|nr:amidohydrolase family protein [Gemmatimonadaceae bacterium]